MTGRGSAWGAAAAYPPWHMVRGAWAFSARQLPHVPAAHHPPTNHTHPWPGGRLCSWCQSCPQCPGRACPRSSPPPPGCSTGGPSCRGASRGAGRDVGMSVCMRVRWAHGKEPAQTSTTAVTCAAAPCFEQAPRQAAACHWSTARHPPPLRSVDDTQQGAI
jgi:hypothetical protein